MAHGKELTRVQMGLQPRDGKWLTDIGPGVQEIRIPYDKEAYRVIYVARLADCVYVLHAFHKKAKKGIATPQEELDLASKRYRELVRSLRRSESDMSRNPFLDLGFPPEEAAALHIRSQLAAALEYHIERKGWSQTEAARAEGAAADGQQDRQRQHREAVD